MPLQGRLADDRAVLRAAASGEATATLPRAAAPPAGPLVRALAARCAAAGPQALRFGTVGLLGTLINLAVYGAFVADAGLAPPVAAIAGFLVAASHNHLLNRVWTFADRDAPYLPQGARFLAISLVALAINLAVLRALIAAGLGHLSAQLLGIAAATPVSFAMNRAWTFKGRA
jgi:putative flippase GtrA